VRILETQIRCQLLIPIIDPPTAVSVRGRNERFKSQLQDGYNNGGTIKL